MSPIRAYLKGILPNTVLTLRQRCLEFNELRRAGGSKQMFATIYAQRYWGKSEDPFDNHFSGPGSHRPEIVGPYVSAVIKFLRTFDKKPNAVDLGCGDFAVGSLIRPYCSRYVACDIVDALIVSDRTKYANSAVDFRVLDMTADDLPEGDIVFIRQVFQHLSNRDIKKVINRLLTKYRLMIVTEHLPLSSEFTPNRDKPTGPRIRIDFGESGVVLTEHPFNLKAKQSTILCEVCQNHAGRDGVVRTMLYSL
jgi:Methyltransferase domain